MIVKIGIVLVMTLAMIACGGPEEKKAKYFSRAHEYMEVANYPKARVALRNVLKIDPKDGEAYYLFAQVEEKEKNWRNAVQLYQETVRLVPDHTAALITLGKYYLEARLTDHVLEVADTVLRKDPRHPQANALKIAHGGWLPLVIGGLLFTLMTTWRTGRQIVARRLTARAVPLDEFMSGLAESRPMRVPGTAVLMTAQPRGTPPALAHNLRYNKVLHERIIMLNVQMEDVPHVPEIDRVEVHKLKHGFNLVIVRFGFKDEPDVPAALGMCGEYGVCYEPMETSFFLARETIIPCKKRRGMPPWREVLFTWMFRNADTATAFFKIPPNRVVELGSQIEI